MVGAAPPYYAKIPPISVSATAAPPPLAKDRDWILLVLWTPPH